MPNLPIHDVSDSKSDLLKADATPTLIAPPKTKFGDALKAIGQSVQGFEIELTRDKTPTDAAIFESR